MKSSSNSFFNTKFNARLLAGLITLLAALMLMNVRAFMQEQETSAAKSAAEQGQNRTEPPETRTPLGPGVALTYAEMDTGEQPAANVPASPSNSDNEKLFVEAGQKTPPVRLAPASVITCNGAGGNWSAAGTWTGGVPTGADDVTITSGCTVTIDTAAVALNVNVQSGGVLQYDSTATRSLTVGLSVTIDSGGTLQSATTGTVTNHVLSIGGNLTNNGTLDFSTNANTAGADITFVGAIPSTFGGTGATTDIRTLTVNKPLSTVEVTTTNFTVQGTTTDGAPMAFATLTAGTLKISGSFTVTGRVFTSAGYTIAAGAGFWLNNPNFTVAGQNGSPTNNGVLRVSAGTFNMGTVGTNVMGAGAGAIFAIEGGTMNVAGRLTSTNPLTYTQSSGTLNICTAGGCTTTPSFGFTSSLPTNVMNMSGGTINMVNSNTLTTPDYSQAGTINFTGGTVQFGTAATATNFNFRMVGNAPNVVIDNTTNNKTLLLTATSYVYGNFTITTGATFNPNAAILNMLGSTFTNNGAVTGCGAASTSRLQFSGSVAQSYTGTGTACTAANPLFGFSVINRGPGVTIDPAANPIFVARLLLFSGSLFNTNKVDVNQAGTSVMVVQRGGVAQLPVGNADVAPSFTGGTSFLILVYSQASNAATTGVEIPASRTIRGLQEFNTNGVTLAGGPLTSTGSGGAAPDSLGLLLGGTTAGVAGGPLNTSAANLLTIASPVTGALLGGSENSYVNGPIARVLPASLASGSTYVFPVGKSMYKGFELVNPTTNAGGTVTVQAEVFDADSGGTGGTGLDDINHNRYWNAQITSGAANFTNSSVRVTELNSTGNALGQSATQGGAYASVGGTLAAATVQSSAATTPLGFFAVGRLTGTTTFPGGTFTVGTGGNYTNLTAAMADLSGKIITGPITYSLLATYSSAGETFPITVPRNGGSNAANTITIKPAPGVTASITGSTGSLVRINGCFVTIDGSNTVGGTTRDLTVQDNLTTASAALWVASSGTSAGATNVTLKNMNIRANGGGAGTTANIFGIFAGGTAVATNGNNNDFLTIQNNAIDTAYEAIAVRVTTVLDGINNGLNINNNVIGSNTPANYVTFRGIELIGAVAPYITKNEIFNQQTATITSNIAGIELGSTVYAAQVTRNKVHDIINNEPTQWGAFGIYGSSATNNFGNSIINNAVWNVSTFGFTSVSFSAVGIRHVGGAGYKIYFNSVNMAGTATLANSLSAAFAADGGSATAGGTDLRDNVFVNNITGPATHKAYATYVSTLTAFGTSANLGFGTINYNDYYSTGTGNVANFLNFYGVDHTTLTLWRSSTQNDVNSVSVDPQFISSTNLDLPPASPLVGAGQTIAGITFDILGRGRANPPTIGAYEPLGAPTAAPANIMGIVTTGDGSPLGGVVMTLNSSDGERTTITSASGRYLFDNVSVGQFYLLTPMRVNYNFSPGVQSFSLLGNKTDADFTANATAVVGNPLETHDFFIRQNYLDFMGREPDQGGLDFWSAKIKACGFDSACLLRERIDVSAAFFMSQEFQESGSYIYRMYKASFGAHPTYAQFTPDRARVIGGAGLEQSKLQFADEWVTRAQFQQAYPSSMTAPEFVNKLFDTAGLVPFIAERQAFINSMQGGQTRAQIVRGIAELGTFKDREYNSSFVLMQYFGYLKRDPDQGGYDFWLNVLNNREPNNYKGMVCSFLTSAEYQKRFSSVVVHSNAECGQ